MTEPPDEGELPRRRKQTHLAPQLRDKVDADLAAQGHPEPDPAPHDPAPHDAPQAPPGPGEPRSPEERKSIISSMQRGWERGRSESTQAQAGPSGAEEDDIP